MTDAEFHAMADRAMAERAALIERARGLRFELDVLRDDARALRFQIMAVSPCACDAR